MGQREKWQDLLPLPNLLFHFRLHPFPVVQIKPRLLGFGATDASLPIGFLAKFSLADQKWMRYAPGFCSFYVLLMGLLERATEDDRLTSMGRGDLARSHLSRGKKGP